MRDESGAALVEFALSAVVFFLFVFGTIEFGTIVWQYNMVASVAQDGARYAAVRGQNSCPAWGWSTCTGISTSAAVKNYVKGRAAALGLTTSASDPNLVVACGTPLLLPMGETVSVTVTKTYYPFSSIFPSGSYIHLTSTAHMTMAR